MNKIVPMEAYQDPVIPLPAVSADAGEDAALKRVEHYLKQAARLNRRIEQRLRAQENLRDIATRVVCLPGEGSAGAEVPSDAGNAAARRLAELKRAIDRDVDERYDLINEIWIALDQFDNENIAKMVNDKYISEYKVEQIAQIKHYSNRQIQRLMRGALLELDCILRAEQPPLYVKYTAGCA